MDEEQIVTPEQTNQTEQSFQPTQPAEAPKKPKKTVSVAVFVVSLILVLLVGGLGGYAVGASKGVCNTTAVDKSRQFEVLEDAGLKLRGV